MLALKRRIANSDGDYLYLQQFSRRLVLAYAGQTNNEENLCYVVTTTSEALASCGVMIAGENPVLADGAVVLAEVSIPARFAR